jgi:uncharacterized protein
MNNPGFSKPLLRSGWMRVLFYVVAFIVVSGIVLGIYILGNKGTLDASGLQTLTTGNGLLIVTGFLFVLALVITYIFRRKVDRRSFISLGLELNGHIRDAIAGAMLAIFIISASALVLKGTGHLRWMDIIFDPKALFLAFGSMVLVAFYEELIFRGYILNNLMDSFPKWTALFISAVLFMLFHWNSVGFFPLVNGLILGLLTGLNYTFTRNLWFSICFHIAWKFMEGPVLGFSGNESFQTLLQIVVQGDENITGGANGLEGSVILMAVSLLSGVAFYLLLRKKLNPRSQPVPGRI